MTNRQDPEKSDKSESMTAADTANGEAPDTDQPDATKPAGPDARPAAHPTGTRQAEENLANDPPA